MLRQDATVLRHPSEMERYLVVHECGIRRVDFHAPCSVFLRVDEVRHAHGYEPRELPRGQALGLAPHPHEVSAEPRRPDRGVSRIERRAIRLPESYLHVGGGRDFHHSLLHAPYLSIRVVDGLKFIEERLHMGLAQSL